MPVCLSKDGDANTTRKDPSASSVDSLPPSMQNSWQENSYSYRRTLKLRAAESGGRRALLASLAPESWLPIEPERWLLMAGISSENPLRTLTQAELASAMVKGLAAMARQTCNRLPQGCFRGSDPGTRTSEADEPPTPIVVSNSRSPREVVQL